MNVVTYRDMLERAETKLIFNHAKWCELIDLGFALYEWSEARRRANELREAALCSFEAAALLSQMGERWTGPGAGDKILALEKRAEEIVERWRGRDGIRTIPCPYCRHEYMWFQPDSARLRCDACDSWVDDKVMMLAWDRRSRRWRDGCFPTTAAV